MREFPFPGARLAILESYLDAFSVLLALENLTEIQDIFEIPNHSLMERIAVGDLTSIVDAVVVSFY